MSQVRLNIALAVILLLGIAVNTYIGLDNYGRVSRVSTRNCHGLSALARIEHRLLQGQHAQSKALLAHGFNFGIPEPKLHEAVVAGEVLTAQFLRELEALGRASCRLR